MNDPAPKSPDPIDVEAAQIDARSPEAAEDIEHLKEDARRLGRHVEDTAVADERRRDPDAPGAFIDGDAAVPEPDEPA